MGGGELRRKQSEWSDGATLLVDKPVHVYVYLTGPVAKLKNST